MAVAQVANTIMFRNREILQGTIIAAAVSVTLVQLLLNAVAQIGAEMST